MNIHTEKELLAHIKLQFHTQQANYDDVWLQGYEECLGDIDETYNPFHEGTPEHSFWQEGWWAAFYGEEPLFNYSGEAQIVARTTTNDLADLSLPVATTHPIVSRLTNLLFWGNRNNNETRIIGPTNEPSFKPKN